MPQQVIPRTEMSKQAPEVRCHNFDEVALGFTKEEAMTEASRCLQCKNPQCVKGCPVEVRIPNFIKLITEGKFDEAADEIREKNSLPAICGRVCPQENQCEGKCILGIKHKPVSIGSLERFASQYGNRSAEKKVVNEENAKKRVVVIGSGPAGLAAASDLALAGFQVDIFESLHKTGGVLRYGIPQFRLPKEIVDAEVEYVKSLGVNIYTNVLAGVTVDISEKLKSGYYSAAFIGTGAGVPNFMGVPGENLNGVYSANEFLTRINLMKAYRFPEYDTPVRVGKKVAVIGAGNVAMDSARTALRMGAEEVSIVYRRSRAEMPARHEEIENAEEEGVILRELTAPVEVLGDDKGNVIALKCIKMELSDVDASGRRRPVPVEGSEFVMDCDTIVVAIGQGSNPVLVSRMPGLELTKRGNICTYDEYGATSIPGVYAGGDIVTGAATVISAMGAGKMAAKGIVQYLTSK